MSKYLEFTKLAIVASSESYPPTSPVAEGKSSSGKSVHPMQQKTQGGNGSYGMSTDNSPSTTISQATTSPGPTGSTKLWAPQQQQINAHPHSSGASLMGFGSYTNLANSTTVTSTPAVNKAVAGLNTNNLEQAQVNIANTGQYGDRTTMNRTDFQTPGPVVNKVDTLASAAGVLDSCLEKLASYVYDPSESHFQRLLRKEGEKAIEAGDMDRATKLAVASNALACLESVVDEEITADKTAAVLPNAAALKQFGRRLKVGSRRAARNLGNKIDNLFTQAASGMPEPQGPMIPVDTTKGFSGWWNKTKDQGTRLLIEDQFVKAPKGGVADIYKHGRGKVSKNAAPVLEMDANGRHYLNQEGYVLAGKPRGTTKNPNNGNIFDGYVDGGPATPEQIAIATEGVNKLGNPHLRALKQWVYDNPYKANPIIAAGTGLAATGLAAALPEIDDPQNIFSRTYNRVVQNPLAFGLGVGLIAPKAMTGTPLMNLNQHGGVQAIQDAASLGGAGVLGYNYLLKPDLDRRADSFTQEITGGSNRTVRDNMQRNMIIGGGLGALGGLGAAYAANRLGDLGFDMGDYAKYVAGGATLGSGLGALNSSLGVNYNKDVNYLN